MLGGQQVKPDIHFHLPSQVGNKQQVIYKHAISTIAPGRTVDFREEEDLTSDK